MIKKHAKKLLIPHDKNDHQPHLLRGFSTKVFLGIAIFFEFIFLIILSPIFPQKLENMAAVLPSVLVMRTNESREDVGQNKLEVNNLLVQAAQLKANDMAEKSYFSHVSPGGETPWYWVNAVGYNYENAGENLAVNFVDSDDVYDAWMDSPTHKANILRNDFTEIGIATAKGYYKGKKVVFAAQFFGNPKKSFTASTTNIPILEEVEVETPEQINIVSNDPILEEVEVETPEQINIVSNDPILEEVEVETPEQINIVSNDPILESVKVLGEVAINTIEEDQVEEDIKIYQKLLASPKSTLDIILSTIFIIILIALILKIFIKIKIQHPKLIINGLIILVIITILLFFNSELATYYLEIL